MRPRLFLEPTAAGRGVHFAHDDVDRAERSATDCMVSNENEQQPPSGSRVFSWQASQFLRKSLEAEIDIQRL